MVSGAGRIETRRSLAAFDARAAAAAGSSSCATPRAARVRARSPIPGAASIGRSRASTSRRSATDRTAVSRTRQVAAHSPISPRLNAANVCGISAVNAAANPSSRPPRAGDSRRANAT